jgi:hypothetical protein
VRAKKAATPIAVAMPRKPAAGSTKTKEKATTKASVDKLRSKKSASSGSLSSVFDEVGFIYNHSKLFVRHVPFWIETFCPKWHRAETKCTARQFFE